MKTKICTKCKEEKELSKFYKDKSKPDGHRPDCKLCIQGYEAKHKDRKSRNNKKYFNSKPWKRIINNINYRINTNDPKIKPYYKDKNIQNFLTEEIKFLWFRDKPEIDRKDSNKNYILENCQFIEKIDHRIKDNSKPILQFDLNDNFIRKFSSIKEASKKLKIHDTGIVNVAKGKRNRAGKYRWKYAI